jgi:LysR family transcriptional activator of nhaA
MDWLNYHHLLYFRTVVREGGVSRAAEKLRLAQPTVSAQVRMLEEMVGDRLFERQGRRLVLTDVGRLVYRYADEIFGIGHELLEALKGRPSASRPVPLTVGVANAVPKLVVHRLLAPAVGRDLPIHLVCREDNTETLLAELATHAVDVVIADVPAPPHVRVKVFNHLLGESTISFFAAGPTAARLRRGFPRSLNDAPLLLPTRTTALRRALDHWFDAEDLHPHVEAEGLRSDRQGGVSRADRDRARSRPSAPRAAGGSRLQRARALLRDLRRAPAEAPRRAGHHGRRAVRSVRAVTDR